MGLHRIHKIKQKSQICKAAKKLLADQKSKQVWKGKS